MGSTAKTQNDCSLPHLATQSSLCRGSSFILYLRPLLLSAPVTRFTPTGARAHHYRGKVLFIGHQLLNHRLLALLLCAQVLLSSWYLVGLFDQKSVVEQLITSSMSPVFGFMGAALCSTPPIQALPSSSCITVYRSSLFLDK